MTKQTLPLLDLTITDWPNWFSEQGGKPFHAKIAAKWIFQRGINNWLKMTDLPQAMREKLSKHHPLCRSTVEASSTSPDGASKVLLKFPDGAMVEAVSMPGTKGRTICLSTQVGCPVRCTFCASGANGLERNLTPSEILEQVLYLREHFGEFGRVVVMGMGDAGYNLQAVLTALDTLIDEQGANMAARRITLSTVAPKNVLSEIANWGKQVTVAISLHAADDELRHSLIPGLAKRSISETLDEAEQLFSKNHREYTIEYVLLGGVNDSLKHAQELASLLQNRRCHLNLIPYNEIPGFLYQKPSPQRCSEFAEILKKQSVSTTLRRSLGQADNAACGQLRRHQAATNELDN